MSTAEDISAAQCAAGSVKVASNERRHRLVGIGKPECRAEITRDGTAQIQFRKRKLCPAAVAIDVTVKEVISFGDPTPEREHAPATCTINQKMSRAGRVFWSIKSAQFPYAGASAIFLPAKK